MMTVGQARKMGVGVAQIQMPARMDLVTFWRVRCSTVLGSTALVSMSVTTLREAEALAEELADLHGPGSVITINGVY